jgi:small subunit ribosomal protein S18
MSEQVNPTSEENEETVETVVESVEETTAEVVESVAAVTEEVEAKAAPVAKKVASLADDDDDFDDDDDDEYDEYAEDDDIIVREVDGPASYAPREKRGRNQRVGNDIKLEDIDYKRVAVLTRFLDPRGRILSRRKTRVSAKIQRRAAKEIKRARHLALLPYTAEQTRITRKRGR